MPAVTFRFSGDYEIQYSSHVPEVGDRVTHAGAIWTESRIYLADALLQAAFAPVWLAS